jgi:hypothetical protein
VYVQYFWQKNHQIYGHTLFTYTLLANPDYTLHEGWPLKYVTPPGWAKNTPHYQGLPYLVA